MYLHEDKKTFKQLILIVAKTTGFNEDVIIKDYYTFLLLKELNAIIPGLVFKGGTSLSRCLKLIKRFSEDIDLTLCEGKGNQANRKRMVKTTAALANKLGLRIKNPENIKSGLSYNCFELLYDETPKTYGIYDAIKVETVFMTLSYPCEYKSATCYIGDYLFSINRDDLAKIYSLEPFDILVQSIERTFIDKVFAICDYYVKGITKRNSRHIYDLYKLYPLIKFDNNFKDLIVKIRAARKSRTACVSAHDGFQINKCLNDIVNTAFYKDDYDLSMPNLLQENVTYEESINVIKEIIKLKMF